MLLKDLINNIKPIKTEGDLEAEISGISYDSRETKNGDVFVAIPGFNYDGARFIPQAIQNGAKAVVCEKDVDLGGQAAKIIVQSARSALADLAAKFYDYPSRKLKIIGITGTNGKTTTSYLLESIFKKAGFKTGVIGTVETRMADQIIPTTLTTPESLDLQKYLRKMTDAGITYVVMEVSSHAISLKRIRGIEFDSAVFTNLTHDHLDFHKTLESYLDAKLQLFRNLNKGFKKNSTAIINIDDEYSDAVIESSSSKIFSYSMKKNDGVYGKIVKASFDEMELEIKDASNNVLIIKTSLIGEYNAYNICAAAAAALSLGISEKRIIEGIEAVRIVPGRFEKINEGQPFYVIVDFAHSPDSLKKLLETAKLFKKGKIILVFGCTGNRDKFKRPIMGEIAGLLSDFTIITSDDPYSEDPNLIISEIEPGIKKSGAVLNRDYIKITDRKAAIERSIEIALQNDIVVIAGRGHEKIQDINGKKIEIDDRIVARSAIKKKFKLAPL